MPKVPMRHKAGGNVTYLGLDPGVNGGLALIEPGVGISLTPMPGTEADVMAWLIAQTEGMERGCKALLEKVHAMPGNGVSSMFKFGAGYGGLRMALVACGIPFEEVSPQQWQKALSITSRKKGVKGKDGKRTGEENQKAFKQRLRAKAQELFPGVEVSLKTADALLLAEVCRRRYGGAHA